jgi:P-type E1-E2 ATPase
MIVVDVPGWSRLELVNLLLDVNGTLALDGSLLPGVAERTGELARQLDVCLITADTHGKGAQIAKTLGVRFLRIEAGAEAGQKEAYLQRLGAEQTVAIGNGANDAYMLKAAALGIAVFGGEGLATGVLQSADIVTGNILDALDLLLKPNRLIATLRR